MTTMTTSTTTTPTVSLPLGDINVVVVTDVHSWVGGHGVHDSKLNADYGDVLSFFQELKASAATLNKDVFFVMNGDIVDGTGLSTVPPHHLLPIIQQMPFSAVNIGNHELYHNQTMEYLRDSGFIDHWDGHYLTSNTFWTETQDHIGHPYTYLYGEHSNTKVLTFGFLYNFEGNCKITKVHKVQETIQQQWFQSVLLQRDYDAILVLAHIDYVDPLITVLHHSIRDLVGDEMPIQFLNGHSHRRGSHVYDTTCHAFEAGRFLDTVGFVSFPTYASVRKSASPGDLFRQVYLDANKDRLAEAVGTHEKTADGNSLTDFIHQQQHDMGLDRVLGCSNQTYRLMGRMNETDSLYRFFMEHVYPFGLGYNKSKLYIEPTGTLRYNLMQGYITLDDVIAVNPFEDPIFLAAPMVKGSDIITAFPQKPRGLWQFPDYVWSGNGIDPNHWYDVYTSDFPLKAVRHKLARVTDRVFDPAIPLEQTDGTVLTDTQIWKNFVLTKMSCNDTGMTAPMRRLAFPPRSTAGSALSVMVSASVLIAGLLLAVLLKKVRGVNLRTVQPKKSFTDYGSLNNNNDNSTLADKWLLSLNGSTTSPVSNDVVLDDEKTKKLLP